MASASREVTFVGADQTVQCAQDTMCSQSTPAWQIESRIETFPVLYKHVPGTPYLIPGRKPGFAQNLCVQENAALTGMR